MRGINQKFAYSIHFCTESTGLWTEQQSLTWAPPWCWMPVAVIKRDQQQDPISLFEHPCLNLGLGPCVLPKSITSLRQYPLVQFGAAPQCVAFGRMLSLRVQPFGMFEPIYLGGQCSLQSFFLARASSPGSLPLLTNK